jgi:hypothetical protein
MAAVREGAQELDRLFETGMPTGHSSTTLGFHRFLDIRSLVDDNKE